MDIENDESMKTHSTKAVLRAASTLSRGWGSSDKNSNSRWSREARSSRSALFRLVVWKAIRKNAVKQIKRPYVDHLDDREQTADNSLEWGACYGDDPCDSQDHRRDDFDDIGSFGKSRIGWISGWRIRMRCKVSGFVQTLLVHTNGEYLAGREEPLEDRGHDCRPRRRW